METEQFEALMMYVLVGGLMLFMFFISGAKERAPAASMALIERLKT